MLIILTVMLLGICTGRLLRKRAAGVLPRVITTLVWFLLFILGAEAGGNEQVVAGFSKLGAEAFIITLAGVAGSIMFSFILWRITNGRRGDGK